MSPTRTPESGGEIPVLDVTGNLVILTGAGISAESGLRTFRDSGGLWEGHRIEDVATPEGFARNPVLVHDFYNMRRAQLKTAQPNAGHFALAELERKWQGNFLLVTQNVDNLHERAGSRKIIHMHGELTKVVCQRTFEVFDYHNAITGKTLCRCCQRTETLRPRIVWFGEMPLELERIYQALQECDIFIAIGTSGVVYPAAGFVMEASAAGAYTIECNLEPSGHPAFDAGLYGPATEVLPRLTGI